MFSRFFQNSASFGYCKRVSSLDYIIYVALVRTRARAVIALHLISIFLLHRLSKSVQRSIPLLYLKNLFSFPYWLSSVGVPIDLRNRHLSCHFHCISECYVFRIGPVLGRRLVLKGGSFRRILSSWETQTSIRVDVRLYCNRPDCTNWILMKTSMVIYLLFSFLIVLYKTSSYRIGIGTFFSHSFLSSRICFMRTCLWSIYKTLRKLDPGIVISCTV